VQSVQSKQRELEVALARAVDSDIPGGWDQVRFEATLLGNVTSCLSYVSRSENEERSSPPFTVADTLDDLKDALARPGQGTWISLTLVLNPEGGLTIHYNYDQEVKFGLGVTMNDFVLELELFPRDDASVPAWWQERIARGDE
jgi:hypothetical protein